MCSLISDERLQLLTHLCTSFLPLRHIRGTIQQGEALRHSLVWVAHPWPMVFWKHILNDNPKLKKRNKWGDWSSWLFEFKDQGIARNSHKPYRVVQHSHMSLKFHFANSPNFVRSFFTIYATSSALRSFEYLSSSWFINCY